MQEKVPETVWDANNSIQICRELLRRDTAANIALGLELSKAKFHLKHGLWYTYLVKIGIDPSGATRRMALAKKYLERSGLLSGSEIKPSDKLIAIYEGIKLITINHADLHDLEKEDLWNSVKNCKPLIRTVGGVHTQSIFGFSLSRLSKRISDSLSRRLRKNNYIETAETLETEANLLNGWAEAMQQLAQQCITRAQEIRIDYKKAKTNRHEWKLKGG